MPQSRSRWSYKSFACVSLVGFGQRGSFTRLHGLAGKRSVVPLRKIHDITVNAKPCIVGPVIVPQLSTINGFQSHPFDVGFSARSRAIVINVVVNNSDVGRLRVSKPNRHVRVRTVSVLNRDLVAGDDDVFLRPRASAIHDEPNAAAGTNGGVVEDANSIGRVRVLVIDAEAVDESVVQDFAVFQSRCVHAASVESNVCIAGVPTAREAMTDL